MKIRWKRSQGTIMEPPVTIPTYSRGFNLGWEGLALPILTDHGGASCQCCFCALIEVINSSHSLVGLLQVSVDIYSPRNNHTPISLYGLYSSRYNQILSYLPRQQRKAILFYLKKQRGQKLFEAHRGEKPRGHTRGRKYYNPKGKEKFEHLLWLLCTAVAEQSIPEPVQLGHVLSLLCIALVANEEAVIYQH